jgi:hypothetical protein
MEKRPSSSIKLAVAVGCLLGLGPEDAAGEQADRCQRNVKCRTHADNAVRLSEKRSHSEALSEFRAAYAIEPTPRLLLNIGRSLHHLEEWQAALDYYSRYRKLATNIDLETEQTLRRYELEALTSLASQSTNRELEPPPAPLIVETREWPPGFALGLVGGGAALLIVGIGLGSGAIATARDIGSSTNNFAPFGMGPQALEKRGQDLATGAIVLDVLGLCTLLAGVTSIGTWHYLKKHNKTPGQAFRRSGLAPIGAPSLAGGRVVFSVRGF